MSQEVDSDLVRRLAALLEETGLGLSLIHI